MDLITTVEKMLQKEVSEEEAKDFALNRYGELCAYIRSEICRNIQFEIEIKKQAHRKRLLEDYQMWVHNNKDDGNEPASDVDILY
ncbi:hypothetical protein CLU81_0579 [Flavobacterium sp. 9]|uniref:hypothetical protein n=1 Tax=Flavobacterium sp. 9 TaxID=2035198 RepID=UPI000C1A17DE|nr:hypothetical protein [Flavobacterium sp. 9]PIF30171.1 hypothetical protein CLU81_0579 [Flavobacterium sp. 9]